MLANTKRINQLRGSKYISSNYIAEKLGVSIHSFYDKLFHSNFTKKEIKILSDILGVEEGELLL